LSLSVLLVQVNDPPKARPRHTIQQHEISHPHRHRMSSDLQHAHRVPADSAPSFSARASSPLARASVNTSAEPFQLSGQTREFSTKTGW